MIERLEPLIRRLSWIPGLTWMDSWANSMNQKAADFQQVTGDYQNQADQIKGIATDPLGEGGAEEAEGGATDAAKNAEQTGATPKVKAGPSRQYRTQRIAARGSCLMFIFLFILVGVVWTLFFFDPRNIPWRHSMSWWRIATQVALVIIIPIVLNRIIQMWLEGANAKYPDIQFAWDQGLRSLQASGVEIDSVPMFLIIGSESDRQEIAIQQASQFEHRVTGVPGGPAALHWYVTEQAIYLYATDVGWTSSIAAPNSVLSDPTEASSAPTDVISGRVDAVVQASAESKSHKSLGSGEASVALARLRHLCRRIRNIRTPVCPLNGVMVLLPYHSLCGSEQAASELEKAVAADLETIQNESQIRVPVVTVVTGMESEQGFCEIVRRVGPSRSVYQRFGKKFDVATVCDEKELQAFNAHVIGAFEDWVYLLFRESAALSKPGNTNLYHLLCNVRCSLMGRMERFFVRVFAKSNLSHLFSGCYFTATGSTPDRQAFVRGVFDKLAEEQELLEWAPTARREDRRVTRLGRVGLACGLLGLFAVVFLLGQRWSYW